MERFRVYLLDSTGAEVVSHNLYAEDRADALAKGQRLVEASLSPYIVNFTVHKIK